jgi:hypothetical protein
MARATAHLEVTVNDKQLVDHAATLKQTRDTWDSLVKAAKDFSGAYTQDMGKGFADLGKGLAAFNRVDAANISAVFQGLQEAAKADLSKFVKSTEGFLKHLEPLTAGTYNWANQLGRVFGYIKSLDERLDSLGIQQQKTVQLSNQFEGELKQITDAMKLQADTMKGLVQSYAGLNTSLQNALQAQNKLGQQQEETTEKTSKQKKELGSAKDVFTTMERAYIRHSTAFFIAGQQIESAIEGLRTAAQEIDLDKVLARSVEGWGQIREATQKSTKGMVSDLQILKSGALMSSFKIPVDNLAQNMEMLQKLAVRTGQPIQYMMDSFARGVSRLSPAILDNLGLQIKLSEAYDKFAKKQGISVDKMDAELKKRAVLNEVLSQGNELVKDVDPYSSLQGRLDRASAAYENYTSRVKGALLEAAFAITMTEEFALGKMADIMAIRQKEFEKYGRVVSDTAKNALLAINIDAQSAVEEFAALQSVATLDFLFRTEAGAAAARKEQLLDLGLIVDVNKLTREQEKERLQALEKERGLRQRYNEILNRREELEKILYDNFTRRNEKALEGIKTSITSFEALRLAIEKAGASGKGDKTPLGITLQEINKDKAEQLERIRLNFVEIANQVAKVGGNVGAVTTIADTLLNISLARFHEENKKAAQERLVAHQKQNAQGFAELAIAEKLYSQSNMIVDEDRTRLSLAFELEKKQKELADAQKLYLDMDEKASLRGAEGAEYSATQVLNQAKKLKGLADEVAKIQERAALDERVNALLKDQSFWTDQMKRDEAARLSGGKTREQIQMRMVVLQKELNDDLREERNIQLDLTNSIKQRMEAMFTIFGVSFMTGTTDLAERKKRIQLLKEEMDQLKKAYDLMGSGGGGDAEKKLDEMYKNPMWDEILTEDKLRQAARERAADAIAGSQKATTERLTRQEELAKLEIEILNNRRDLRIQDELFKSDAKDAKGTLADNIKLLETLRTYQEKYKDVMTFEEAMYIRGFITGIQDSNKVLMEHIRLWEQVIQGLRDYGTAADWAMKYAKGIISDTEIKVIGDLTANLGGLASTMEKALGGTADSYDLMGAGLNVIRGFTGEYIKDMKQRAKVEMLMNGAMSFAAIAMGNVPKAISHATAATMFGLVAGGAIRLPGQASGQDQKQSTQAGPLHIHLYSEMAMTDAERGYLIDRAVQQAAAEGRV